MHNTAVRVVVTWVCLLPYQPKALNVPRRQTDNILLKKTPAGLVINIAGFVNRLARPQPICINNVDPQP